MSHESIQVTDSVTKEKLVADLKILVADTEELLRATADMAGDRVSAARERMQESLAVAKAKLVEAEQALHERGKVALEATDAYVHDNPWRAVGIAAGAGLLIGLLIRR